MHLGQTIDVDAHSCIIPFACKFSLGTESFEGLSEWFIF